MRSLLLIGAGRMGTALLRGWIAKGMTPVSVVEPSPSPELRKIAARNRVLVVSQLAKAPLGDIRACIIAIKPQILRTEAAALRAVAANNVPMISIAAGTSIETMRKAWGRDARIIRTMPNTPGAIQKGITALFAPKNVTGSDRRLAEKLLAALGETVWVERESMIDTVTAVSGSGPAYVFLFVEALAAAAKREGIPRALAEQLARATIMGAGALLEADKASPEELRRAVTSKGGTTEAALKVFLEKPGLYDLVARAVAAARRRAGELA